MGYLLGVNIFSRHIANFTRSKIWVNILKTVDFYKDHAYTHLLITDILNPDNYERIKSDPEFKKAYEEYHNMINCTIGMWR